MKKVFLLMLVLLTAGTLLAIDPPDQTTDILGAHNAYGRGCVACHAPHSGPAGNGGAKSLAGQGNLALWGQDMTPLMTATDPIAFGDWGGFPVTMPAAYTNPFDATTGIMMCLSCHDGNLAHPSMMTGTTVETLPIVGGNAPTLLGNDGSTAGNYQNDHPVGPKAVVGCGGKYDWDCTITLSTDGTKFSSITPGPHMTQFIANYGFTAELFDNGAKEPMVTCISCHDQHSQTAFHGTIAGAEGNYKTMFFVRGYYNPKTGSNSVSQFCRQCHGGEGNEMHGVDTVPTV